MSEEYTDYIFKALAIGDGGCGKTALCVQFAQGFFQENYKLTIGVEFFVKTIKVKNYSVKLQIWDTGGQERFAYVRPMYYKGALGAILLFDITNRESFEHLTKWIEEVSANVGGKIPLLLVGNKADLVDQRKVTREEAEAFAREHDMYYMESSAKTAFGVRDVFGVLALLMIGESIPEDMLCQEVTAPCKDKAKPKVEDELPTFEEYKEFSEEKPKFETESPSVVKPTVTSPATVKPVTANITSPSFTNVEPTTKPAAQPSVSPAPAFKPAAQPSVSPAPAFKPAAQPSVSPAPAFKPAAQPSLSPAPAFKPAAQPSVSPAPAFKPAAQPSVSPAPAFKPAAQPSVSPAPAFKPAGSQIDLEDEDIETPIQSVAAKKIEIHKKPVVIETKDVGSQSNKPSFISQSTSAVKSANTESENLFAPPVPEKGKMKPSLKPISSPVSGKSASDEYFASSVAEKPKEQNAELDTESLFGPSEEEADVDDNLFAPPVPEKKTISPAVIVFDEVKADAQALEKGFKAETKAEPIPQKKSSNIEAFKPKTSANSSLFNPLAPENLAPKEKRGDIGVNPFILPSASKDKEKSAAANPMLQPSKPLVASNLKLPEASTLNIPTAKTLQTEKKPLDKKAQKELEKQEKERLKREQEEKKKREKDLKKRKLRECPQCNAELPEKFKFCNKCGAKL